MKRVLLVILALFLISCTEERQAITYIGVATGSLTTNLEQLQFRSNFPADEHEIVAVASLDQPLDGANVQATWFSPDERRMPMGRSSVLLESGATIARFSLRSATDWNPAPFTLRIDVYHPGETATLTSSGNTAFFIGMNQSQIDEYLKEFNAWKAADAETRSRWEAKQAREADIVRQAALLLRENDVEIAARYDIDGNGSEELFVASKQEGPTGGGLGVITSLQTSVFAIMNSSGSSIISLENARGGRILRSDGNILYQAFPSSEITVTLLASGTMSIAWNADDTHCAMDVFRENEHYRATDPTCR